ncbi:MAG: DEAD/DEAH box helicase [Gammaproteobacteria bacterium]|nr:DEAD/DEAH box helicase [Gammaproteobacteria bacterium]
MSNSFESINVSPAVRQAIASRSYVEPTPIQAASIDKIVAGADVVAKAETGSGKSLAFVAGVLSRVQKASRHPRTLILCPTRELAQQVAETARFIATHIDNFKILLAVGGTPIGPQIRSLEHGASMIIGTPGRIADLIRKERLDLSRCDHVVLDEADRMLDMGFIDAVSELIEHCASPRQTLMFSATFPSDLKALSERHQNNPEIIDVSSDKPPSKLNAKAVMLEPSETDDVVLKLIANHPNVPTLIFCPTISEVKRLSKALYHKELLVVSLHGDLDQPQRERAFTRFKNHSIPILVATDVAARGLDVDSVELVISTAFAKDESTQVHRNGRTARAGKEGKAFVLVNSERAQQRAVAAGLSLIHASDIQDAELTPAKPDWISCEISLGKKNKLRKGDFVGALAQQAEIPFEAIGQLDLFDYYTIVAVNRHYVNKLLALANRGAIKKRKFKVRAYR